MPIELAPTKSKRQRSRPDVSQISTVQLINRYSSYPSDGLTPYRLTQILKEADQGDISQQAQLFEEMLRKDLFLYGLFDSRRKAVLKCDYEIVPADDTPEEKEIAEFVRKVLDGSRRWREDLENLLDAVPKGFSTSWIGWQILPDGRVIFDRLNWIKQRNFRFGKASDIKSDLNEIRRLTDENLIDGIELEQNKWVVAVIKATCGFPGESALMRPCAFPYLFNNLSLNAFVIIFEKFGVPFIVGLWKAGAGPAEKEALETAIQGLSTDSAAVISDTTEITFPAASSEKGTSKDIHDRLIQVLKDEMSVGVLGHTGGGQSTPGKLGNDDSAQEVRHDLIQSDALALDYVISDQVIKPLVFFNYGPRERYPFLKTKAETPKNLTEMIQVDEGLVRMGWKPPVDYITETYGRPVAQEGEAVLEPRQQQAAPFGSALAKTLYGTGKLDLLR
jgi:phage gp29-like protein